MAEQDVVEIGLDLSFGIGELVVRVADTLVGPKHLILHIHWKSDEHVVLRLRF